MTTSSSERGRCTRISPSAILDDRLEGHDLEWALDHLKGCDACRDRIEEFREIVVRVERLPMAPIPPAVVRDAYTWAIPEGLRTDPDLGVGTLESPPPVAAPRAEPARIELPDWEAPLAEEVAPPSQRRSLVTEEPPSPPSPPATLFPLEETLATPVHEVAVDSRRSAPALVADAQPVEEATPTPPDPRHEARVATMTRVSVGLVAAACVLLAGVLYADGGILTAFRSRPAPSHIPAASPRSSPAGSVRPSAQPSPSVSASPSPTAPAASVVATLGDGVAGAQVFQIRLGTQDPRFTRLVFDMNAQGLPTMIITQPDASHVVVTFKDTTGAGVPTGGIHTARVAGLEPAAQRGNDLVFTVDLARPVQIKAFTLAPPPRFRLVLDLY